ncbi:MAG: 5'-nucleotidase C-terminal domain-containing protein [Bacteroidales bacterium]|nr:5'-nucleotidase C-terminal domain-containing protein [Bacteroidales bacterium]MDE5955888.1 5'-nucleotidase C-terminal domain-containing protein [Bacteroidales bacterium]MDE6147867.1 5'-nucleotidase C-terminal domain-containing protein [Bacteroidales bacterium]
MKNILLNAAVFLALACTGAGAQEYSWTSVAMDGSRTGCTAPAKDNVAAALGKYHGCRYVSPSGKAYKRGSAVAKTAKIVIDAQPGMARVKEVIAYSPKAMEVVYPEGPLSNWFIDILMAKTEKLSGRKVDIGVGNFGGIRVNMPQGDVMLDDMVSMFPFKNQLVYVEHKGSELRSIIEKMAATRFQVLGGVRVIAKDGKVVCLEIGGEPLDDDKTYGMATISFLLNGGDNLMLGNNALYIEKYDVDIIDAVLEHVSAETAAGRPIVSESDGRVVILD